MPRGILPLSQPDVRLVSPMQAAPSFFGLGKNLFLSVEMAANCHPTGFGKNSKQTKRSSFRLNDNRYQCCDAGRVVHKFIKRVNKVRLKTFVPYNLFHTKFSAIVAIIRWTMLLEKVFHLPQPCFSFVSVLPQNRRNPAVRRVHFATN